MVEGRAPTYATIWTQFGCGFGWGGGADPATGVSAVASRPAPSGAAMISVVTIPTIVRWVLRRAPVVGLEAQPRHA